MRNKERTMIVDAEDFLQSAIDLVATVLEVRYEDDEGGVAYDLRVLYAKINDCIDDAREIAYDI